MSKLKHEIRDPIHGFIKVLQDERKILDSKPIQRLRDIHQLGLTYLLYPSATHKRFEHSLGVMELAARVYDVITSPENILPALKKELTELENLDELRYWRRVIRMAALCHDIGHLPFSHAVEKEIFPEGWDHEKMTAQIIEDCLNELFMELTPPVRAEDVIKIALGPEKISKIHPNWEFTPWESILAEIIVGNVFGVDRMDYLLRDSYHIGVAYGKFDHFRLIDTLRILPNPDTNEPELGIEIGGMHVAESLVLARYFMYSQVYFHHVRRIYDYHLKDYLKIWLKEKCNSEFFPTKTDDFLNYSDSVFMNELQNSARENSATGYEVANLIVNRKHYKLIYELNPQDVELNPNALRTIYKALIEKYGKDKIIIDEYEEKGGILDFLVIDRNKQIFRARGVSELLDKVPRVSIGLIFADREIVEEAKQWLKENKFDILEEKEVVEDE